MMYVCVILCVFVRACDILYACMCSHHSPSIPNKKNWQMGKSSLSIKNREEPYHAVCLLVKGLQMQCIIQ